ncbi:MAG: hypothetical protein AAFQ50_06430 [Pseudomonadota bacterium]
MLFAAAGFLLGASQDAPEAAGFRFDYGRQTVTGVVEFTPYGVLHVTGGTERIPAGTSLLLAGQGKTGVDPGRAPGAGALAQISGTALERGTITMLQVAGGRRGVQAADGSAPDVSVEPLGRWRLAGEICDGKCLSGAMRPGRGLAHKACANLCISGDVPPVFVSSQPVAGTEFMLITGPDGGPLPPEGYDRVGQYVSLEGELERRGTLLVLRMDPRTLEVLP